MFGKCHTVSSCLKTSVSQLNLFGAAVSHTMLLFKIKSSYLSFCIVSFNVPKINMFSLFLPFVRHVRNPDHFHNNKIIYLNENIIALSASHGIHTLNTNSNER